MIMISLLYMQISSLRKISTQKLSMGMKMKNIWRMAVLTIH